MFLVVRLLCFVVLLWLSVLDFYSTFNPHLNLNLGCCCFCKVVWYLVWSRTSWLYIFLRRFISCIVCLYISMDVSFYLQANPCLKPQPQRRPRPRIVTRLTGSASLLLLAGLYLRSWWRALRLTPKLTNSLTRVRNLQKSRRMKALRAPLANMLQMSLQHMAKMWWPSLD